MTPPPYRRYPDATWLDRVQNCIARLYPGVLLVLAVVLLILLAFTGRGDASVRQHLWLPAHLDRNLVIDADYAFGHYPTISIGDEQIWLDAQHRSVYFKLTRTSRADLPEHAYSHGQDGRRLMDSVHHGLYVGDPASSAWQQHVIALCHEAVAGLDSDTCFGDGVGLSSYYRMTGRPYTDDGRRIRRSAWVDRIVAMLRAFPSSLRVVANTAGWESQTVADAAWARSVEGTPDTPERYRQTMLGSRAWLVAYQDANARLARFMLWAGPEDRFASWARDRKDPLAWPSAFSQRVGQPATGAVNNSGVVTRRYTTGLAAWNTTSTTRSVPLSRTYQRPDGTVVSGRLSIRAGQAILLGAVR